MKKTSSLISRAYFKKRTTILIGFMIMLLAILTSIQYHMDTQLDPLPRCLLTTLAFTRIATTVTYAFYLKGLFETKSRPPFAHDSL